MKKRAYFSYFIFILIFNLMILPLTALAADQNSVISIPDKNLKAAIRTEGDLTIKDMQALTTLNITGKPIASLEGLQYATNLQELQLSDNGLKDIKIIGQLPSLSILNLSTNSIRDISPLANLNHLRVLDLSKNPLTNIAPLRDLTVLNELTLDHNQIQDIKPLANLINLDKLSLEENGLTDISVLRTLNKSDAFKMGDQIHLGNNELNLGDGTETAKIINEIKANHTTVVWEPQKRIQLNINGKYIDLPAAPVVINNRTMVPVRAIFENLGASVEWNAKTRVVSGNKDGTYILLTVNNKLAKVNGKNVILDVPATIVNNSVMVPTRFIAETLGKQVKWDDPSRTVIIE